MSDPYADTVTVRNILNHIISPKIVSDGNGGFTTKVDLVNVDIIQHSSQQCGIFVYNGEGDSIEGSDVKRQFTIPVANTVLDRGISFVEVRSHDYSLSNMHVVSSNTSESGIIFTTNIEPAVGDKFSWFIAKF